MKRIMLFLNLVFLSFILTACDIGLPHIEDYEVFNDYYYSVWLKPNDEQTYFIKAQDVNNDFHFIRGYSTNKDYITKDGANLIKLPEEISKFEFSGEKTIRGFWKLLMLSTNNGSYLYRIIEDNPYGTHKIIKVDYQFKENTRNFSYLSKERTNEKYMFNENISKYNIYTDINKNTYIKNDDLQTLLLENVEVVNSFFMIDYFDYEYDYYPMMIVSTNTAYFYVFNQKQEILLEKEYTFDNLIKDYNFSFYLDNENTYFYIIEDEKLHLYNIDGVEIETINVEKGLINSNIIVEIDSQSQKAIIKLYFIYKPDNTNNIFRLEKKEIEYEKNIFYNN